MKISDFSLDDDDADGTLAETVAGFNATSTDYPRDRTIHALFAERVAATPEATAVICGETELCYAELWDRATRLAHLLVEAGVEDEAVVGIMLDRSADVVVALLAALVAGGAYLPISPDLPAQRIEYMLRESAARVLISETAYIRELNKLQWSCPELRATVCLDSDDVHAEIEASGGLMDPKVWAYVAEQASDDISGGGWRSSYTGAWLSREVMDDYGDNILTKLEPYLSKDTRVLEIGCASGISMFRIAPLVAEYHGTDISPGIIEWARREAAARGHDNITLTCLPAHEISTIDQRDYDIVILNSVIECFPGHNYTRDVLRQSVALLGERGLLFLGNIWDLDRVPEFIRSLEDYKRNEARAGEWTKLDRGEELFIPRTFFEDLRHDLPAIAGIEYSSLIGAHESELSRFSYDALVFVDKREDAERSTPGPRRKRQYDRRALAAAPTTALPERSGADGLAYLIYTSGTTGVPKGVMVEHRNVVRLVRAINYIELDASTRLLQTGSLAFDAATFEIWGPLLNGGALILPPGNGLLGAAEFAREIRRCGVTTIFLTTGLFNQLVDADIEVFAGVRELLSGGEKVSVSRFNAVREAHPNIRLLHVYGPTESTTFSSYFPVERAYVRDVPIGRPISNTTIYIIGEDEQLAAIGHPGELCIGGDGLARGYLGDPELTAAKFVNHPAADGQRLYRSGDLGRWTADGAIEFLGRIDNQVKVHGFRIEPGEIEGRLLAHPSVKEAVVIVRERGDDKELIAYVAGDDLELADIQAHAARTLPPYMVPAQILGLAKLPLAPTGKVDRAALPEPARVSATATGERNAPTSATERTLVEIWIEVLDHDLVGVTDNFFDLGGHSLRAVKLIARIEQVLGVDLPLMTIFNNPTIRGLARVIDETLELRAAGVDPSHLDQGIYHLGGEPERPAIVAFPPGSGYSIGYRELALRLPNHAFYGVNYLDTDARLDEYARLIIGRDFATPPVLFGFSGGGKLAYQVAVALERRGHPIAGLVLMDAARYTRPVALDHDEIEELADELFSGVRSPSLRERARQTMRRYREYLSGCVETEPIAAPIVVIEEHEAPQTFHDADGALLAGTRIWSELARGPFELHQGQGAHRAMLDEPNLTPNAALLATIVQRLSTRAAGR